MRSNGEEFTAFGLIFKEWKIMNQILHSYPKMSSILNDEESEVLTMELKDKREGSQFNKELVETEKGIQFSNGCSGGADQGGTGSHERSTSPS